MQYLLPVSRVSTPRPMSVFYLKDPFPPEVKFQTVSHLVARCAGLGWADLGIVRRPCKARSSRNELRNKLRLAATFIW